MSVPGAALRAARALRLFRWAAHGPNRLSVLCYHGFSLRDEHTFRPKLFMRPAVFEARMAWLAREGYRVIDLDRAIEELRRGTLAPRSVVITFDDGFYDFREVAWPILKRHHFPATLYQTTYYCRHPEPIFRLVVHYMFWATRSLTVSVDGLIEGATGIRPLVGAEGERTMADIIRAGEHAESEEARVELARRLGLRLGVSYDAVAATRRLSLLRESEVAELAREGLDVQLHTHRHRLPQSAELMRREIEDNRAVLAPLTQRPLVHLCYPSGKWSRAHWPALEAAGVVTAAVCDPGIIDQTTPLLALPRFLDADNLSMDVFEAEVSGFKNVFRRELGTLAERVGWPREEVAESPTGYPPG